MYDLILKGGTIVDGTGSDRFVGDVAVKDGTIVAVGGTIVGDAVETIDAAGKLVTPGFVDIHTHYDGQVTWDPLLEPSSLHGVTTLVMGNCGVGFAPVPRGKEAWLIELMEGVEDIPGTALSEGMRWEWETFPQYLDALSRKPLALDVGTQIPHAAVRAYVMGERGANNEPATPDDIAAMARIVREAVEAGALGFSTSRTLVHRAIDGQPVPGTFAAEDELFALGDALRRAGAGVFELAPAGAAGEDLLAPRQEIDWMCRLAADCERPVSFALAQIDGAPELWRELMDESLRAIDRGAPVYPQVAGRPAGVLVSFQNNNAFATRPSYAELAGLPFDERIAELRKPERRARILAEQSRFANAQAEYMGTQLQRIYRLGVPPDYEPGPDMTVVALARAEGVDVEAKLYDLFLEDEGRAILMFPFLNYSHGNSDATREMLLHPAGALGLSDGGAHCGAICDASQTTWMLTHWARDRRRGPKLALEWVVRKMTADTARLYGFDDRGVIATGKRADLNVIDFDALTLHPPRMVYDLPANGRRFMQTASGYVTTVVAGTVTRRDGADTGARPGRLLRGSRS